MKQFLLVAGVDYEFKGVNFRTLADNRRRFLERRNTAKADVRFVTMDVRAGQVEIREVTFPGGKRNETVSSTTPFATVGPASYQTLPDGSTRFKPGQWNAMGITDVYQRVQDIGASIPGSLAELSIFSHGWMGGPILVDSDDDRTMEVTLPAMPPLTSSPTTVSLAVQGFARDPDDKDGRPGLDFRPPTMDPSMLDLFRKAFDGSGIAWLWGCSFPRTIHHTLWAMEQAKGYSASGLGDDAVLQMPAVVDDDIAFLNRFLVGALPPFPPHSSSISIAFKHLKLAMCRASQSCYATALANAANVNVHAAPVGTYAEYDTSGDMLMNVFRNFTAHFTFYKNYLGFSFDPENRRYAVYTPGRTCPVPAP